MTKQRKDSVGIWHNLYQVPGGDLQMIYALFFCSTGNICTDSHLNHILKYYIIYTVNS